MNNNDDTQPGLFMDYLRDTARAYETPWLTQYRNYQPQSRHGNGEGASEVAPWLVITLIVGMPLAVFGVVSLLLVVLL